MDVAAGEMETVVDTDEANEMQGGAAWERAVGRGLVDAHMGRLTREGDDVADTVFRDEDCEVFKCRNAVLIWPSGVAAGGFI